MEGRAGVVGVWSLVVWEGEEKGGSYSFDFSLPGRLGSPVCPFLNAHFARVSQIKIMKDRASLGADTATVQQSSNMLTFSGKEKLLSLSKIPKQLP